ncbi:MAG: WD40/YVTN/BNR-like repeat-containing protein, partial [Caulobacteraceae bacterium]
MSRFATFSLGASLLAGLAALALAGGPALAAVAAIPDSAFNAMKWRGIGPYRGGRSDAVVGVAGQPNVFYFGAAAGGVWKTTDAGGRWRPIFDGEPNLSIGAIAVAPSNADIVYVGTGESALRGDITYGNGVYKSADGGRTWSRVGLADSRQIGAVIVDPANPNIVLVAAIGHAFGPNSERGVFRTTDGGRTWTRVLYKDDQTGAIDVTFDPHNAKIVYAALWQVRRQPWNLSSGGPGSGLYRSTDGGATWTHLTGNGLPGGLLGRIDVAVSGADSRRVYAMIEAQDGGLYRSDDGGGHWRLVNQDGRLRQRAWYFSKIYADPKAVDTVYGLNTGLLKSTDGGATFNLVAATHGDHHALWIDPTNPSALINGNDGGASISLDGGKTWSTQENQPTGAFYHVAADNRFPYWVYGAQQDNSNLAVASYDDDGVIGPRDWYPAGGGEAGFVIPDPRDPMIIYSDSENQFGRFDK